MIENYQLKKNALKNSIESLNRKNLIPEHSKQLFDLKKLDYLLHFHEKQVFKEWTCDICGISVYGLNKMLVEHHKIHIKREMRENEIFKRTYHLY